MPTLVACSFRPGCCVAWERNEFSWRATLQNLTSTYTHIHPHVEKWLWHLGLVHPTMFHAITNSLDVKMEYSPHTPLSSRVHVGHNLPWHHWYTLSSPLGVRTIQTKLEMGGIIIHKVGESESHFTPSKKKNRALLRKLSANYLLLTQLVWKLVNECDKNLLILLQFGGSDA